MSLDFLFHKKCNWNWKSLSYVRLFATPWTVAVHGILQARMLEWVAVPSSRGSSYPGIRPRSPALQTDSLPSELPGKPQNQVSHNIMIYNTKICVLSCFTHVSLPPYGLQPARLLCPSDSPGKYTGVGCHALLQNICILMADSCCCMAETNTILESKYPPIKNK